jgi:uncharacterized protein (TIGR03435 family)
MVKRLFSIFTSKARLALLGAGSISLVMPAFAQSAPQAAPGNTLVYEVVSVKPHQITADGGTWWRTTSDGFSASGIGLENMITTAYGLVMPDQISGLPGWAHSDTFDVEAKMDEDTAAAMKALPKPDFKRVYLSMMQSLLADRFQLKVHHETRELPVYNLVIAKGGSKLREAATDDKGWMSMSSKQMSATAVDIHSLTFSLANDVGRFVIDKTGLLGKYDFTVNWTPDDEQATADSGPDIFTALEEQLGLKLVPAKGPVDTIVVDRIEKPSPN